MTKLAPPSASPWDRKHAKLKDALDTAIQRAKARGITEREQRAQQELVRIAQLKLTNHRSN